MEICQAPRDETAKKKTTGSHTKLRIDVIFIATEGFTKRRSKQPIDTAAPMT
jgi:hypothetical protein